MPATAPRYQLVVGYEGYDQPNGPKNSTNHPWRKTSRHGVVRVERAPGVARDAASRPTTPEEREAKEQLKSVICEAWARAEGSASEIGTRYGASRGKVLGIVHRAGVARGTPLVSRPAPAPAPRPSVHEVRDRHIVWCLAASWTVRETAEFHDVTANTVFAVRRRARLDGLLPPAPVRALQPVPTPVTAVTCTSAGRVSLLDAAPSQCRDLGPDGTCCGRLVVQSRSWCPEHLARYTKSARRSA